MLSFLFEYYGRMADSVYLRNLRLENLYRRNETTKKTVTLVATDAVEMALDRIRSAITTKIDCFHMGDIPPFTSCIHFHSFLYSTDIPTIRNFNGFTTIWQHIMNSRQTERLWALIIHSPF